MEHDPYTDMTTLMPQKTAAPTRVDLLAYLCAEDLRLGNEIATKEEELKLLKAERKNLLDSRIPDAVRMNDFSATEVTLDDGTEITLKDSCHINWKKEDESKVYDFVIGRGNEKAVQYMFSITCGKGTHKEAQAIQFLLQKFSGIENIEITGERYINPNTLNALLRKLRATVKLPDFITVFAPTVAMVQHKTIAGTKGDIFE